jgi:thioredoxin reductase (NADPH)
LVDAVATEAVEAFVIPPRRLRDLMVEEAELGERIMRALILRRVALLDTGAGDPQRPSSSAVRPTGRSVCANLD